jgi:hypothetical protein
MIFNNHAKVDVFIEITKYKENILYIVINFFSNSGYNAIVAYHFHCDRFSVNPNSRSEDNGYLVYVPCYSFF